MFLSRFKIYLLLAVLVLASCGKQQKLLKSTDNEAKYAAAIDYYEKNDYYHALQIFQQLINFYQGTEKAEKMQFYYAYCYYHQKDYVLASYYFKRFVNNYPRSAFAEESMFMNAYCYFLDSPNSSLDQTNTYTAIKELQLFINLYPNSDRVEEANKLIDQLRAKLQRKDLDIANLYLKMKLYEAAIYSYKNILKDYPDSEFKEEILFSILKSYYNFASYSISLKQAERYQSALDSYNELVFQFPDTRFLKEAKNINRDVLDFVQGDSSKKKNSHKKNSDIN
jgi:outer membrane protein assembly factor BamD